MNVNTFAESGQFPNNSTFDANQTAGGVVLTEGRAVPASLVSVSCAVMTSGNNTAPCVTAANGVRPPNMFSWCPVLTLPSPGGSPRHRSSPVRSPCTASPRKSPLLSPRSKQSLASKTALEGQTCIDQVFPPVSNRNISLPHSPLSTHSLQSCFASPDRKRTEPAKTFVSPLLSSNRKHFVEMCVPNISQSADVPAVGFTRSENSCDAIMSKDNNSAVRVSQSVSVDADVENATLTNVQVTAADIEQGNSATTVSSSVGCNTSTSTLAQNQSPMKIQLSKLQEMRKILEKSCMLMREKSTKTSSANDTTSEASITLSSSVVRTESTYPLCATSTVAQTKVSAISALDSGKKSSAATDSKFSNTVACHSLDRCLAESNQDRQRIVTSDCMKHGVVELPKMDISVDVHDETITPATDGRVNDITAHNQPDSNATDLQCVKSDSLQQCHIVNNSTMSARNAPDASCSTDQPSNVDNQMDVDNCTTEESDELSYADVESNPFFFTVLIFERNLKILLRHIVNSTSSETEAVLYSVHLSCPFQWTVVLKTQNCHMKPLGYEFFGHPTGATDAISC